MPTPGRRHCGVWRHCRSSLHRMPSHHSVRKQMKNERRSHRVLLSLAVLIAPSLLFATGCGPTNHAVAAVAPSRGLLDRIDQTNELHAGYRVYPPYTQENPNTRAVSGFSVDVINEIGRQLHVKVVWHRLNWNT